MRILLVICLVMGGGCATTPPSSHERGVPLVKSAHTVQHAVSRLRLGMKSEEVAGVLDSIPIVGSFHTTYLLENGSISLRFENERLVSWKVNHN